MNTILNRYRLQKEATRRRASAESAFSSPRLRPPLAISPLSSITQPERDETLRHHAFPLRITVSLTNLHHCPYPSQQANMPPNLNLFRRDSFVFARKFSREYEHGLLSYLLSALGIKVSVEMLSTWAPHTHVREPMGGLMQIVILSDTRTGLELGAHLCAGFAVREWVIGKVEALANHPIRRPGRTHAGINNDPRNEQTSPPTNQRSSAGSHKLKGLRPFAPKHVGKPLRYCLDNGPEFDMSAHLLEGLAASDVDQPPLTLSEPNQWLLNMIGKRHMRAIR